MTKKNKPAKYGRDDRVVYSYDLEQVIRNNEVIYKKELKRAERKSYEKEDQKN